MIRPLYRLFLLCIAVLSIPSLPAQITINEGSNRNHSTLVDSDGDYEDWVELYNAGPTDINLQGYTLTDKLSDPTRWTFPDVVIPAQGFLVVYCSGKDRTSEAGSSLVGSYPGFTPVASWNTHQFTSPIVWDGTSSILIDIYAFRTGSPTLNSIFSQTTTPLPSSNYIFANNPNTATARHGTLSHRRPVLRLNGVTIGSQTWQNSGVTFPAPYSNWYTGAKNAFLLRASELLAAGITPGPINDLAFNVISPNPGTYEQLDIRMALSPDTIMSAVFRPLNANSELHTNFKISSDGERVYLFSPALVQLSNLRVSQQEIDHSNGAKPNGTASDSLFAAPTPGSSNNGADGFIGYAIPPVITVPSSMGNEPFSVPISNPNIGGSTVRFTLDGSDPTESSTLYSGPIGISTTTVLKARAFRAGRLPSPIAAATYLINVSHTTPVLSVVSANDNIFGDNGIFTNWWLDDEKPASVAYFDSDRQLIFSQRAGIQVDGGQGGSRGFPQHSFRLEFDNGVLGDGAVEHTIIPDRPDRTRYGRIYLRNGSNQYLILPHKDAAQVKAMTAGTNGYYSAWRPISVYINGAYFGLYELREKFDDEYFETLEQADPDSMTLLSLSAWNGSALRPNTGTVDPFWSDVLTFNSMNTTLPDYWEQVDQLFDLTYYTDYIFGQMWMANIDWPGNNIKAYRSNVTGQRWRFGTVDMEIAMAPNGQTGPSFNGVQYVASQDAAIPYTNIWKRSVQNPRFHDYFINRSADVMNSAYRNERILGIAQEMFDLTRPEMGRQFLRWAGTDTTTRLALFEANQAAFMNDLGQRTPIVRNHLQNHFSLPRQVDVTLDVFPEMTGKVHISTLKPDTYPWQGVYFDGVPIRLEAVAEEGFVFSHWSSNPLLTDTLNAVFLDTLAANAVTFVAHFVPDDFPTASDDRHVVPGAAFLYPNPTTTQLNIVQLDTNAPAFTRCVLADMRGQLLLEERWPDARAITTLNIAALATGPYQVFLFGEDGKRQVLRFVKL